MFVYFCIYSNIILAAALKKKYNVCSYLYCTIHVTFTCFAVPVITNPHNKENNLKEISPNFYDDQD